MTTFGSGLIAIVFTGDVDLQFLLLTTTTDKFMLPEDPAVYVIVLVVTPGVIVPFVMLQVYVAPVPPLATEAILLVDPLQTDDCAATLAGGQTELVIVTGKVPEDIVHE